MEDIKEFVDSKISGKKVMMFSKSYSPYCDRAKKVFQIYLEDGTLKFDDYEVQEIENLANCSQIEEYLLQLTGKRSVPRVFINGKCIGGDSEILDLHKRGELKKILQ